MALYKLVFNFNLLHEAKDDAVRWLELLLAT